MEMMTLDATLWEEDGAPYIVYCHEWVQISNGTIEYMALKPDLSETVGEAKLMFRGTWSIRNAESRKLMWLGARIAGPSAGSRSKPSRLKRHSCLATGRTTRRNLVCAFPAPWAFTRRFPGPTWRGA